MAPPKKPGAVVPGPPCIRCGSRQRYRPYTNKAGWTGKTGACVECRAHTTLNGRAQRQFGITGDEYRAMKKKAGKKCPICLRRAPTNLDHCHTTGRVRGFICWDCNTAIGKMFDDYKVVYRAYKFLTRRKVT